MIYTFDTRDFCMYPVMKSYFELNDHELYETIQNGMEILRAQLSMKGISYDSLKGALIPNQDKDKFETCFVFDSNQIQHSDYGAYVFEKLLPLLDKESTYSILAGDYIDSIDRQCDNSQVLLRYALKDVLFRCNTSDYIHSSQYYLIYINRLTGSQRSKIVEGFYSCPWFTGFADLTYNSAFKTYISTILVPVCIKSKKQVIVSHPSDFKDEENMNMRGFPFEENGFKLVSINEDSYGAFLAYKIEREVPDKEDISFSFNALFPKFDSWEKLDFAISDDKWNKYLTDKENGKGKIMESLGYDPDEKVRFCKEIYKKICANYIYNLRKNQYGDLLFNVCIELPTVNQHIRRTTIALKYHPDEGRIDLITVT